MGWIKLSCEGQERRLQLAATTLLGRHPSCTWVLSEAQIPTFWVEIRWTRAGWAWRELGGDATGPRKPVACLGTGWCLLERGNNINGRSARVTLLREGPPKRFVVDVERGEPETDTPIEDLVIDDVAGPLPADWEQRDDQLTTLADGKIFTAAGRSYRFHEAVPPETTAQRQLDLERRSCELELALGDTEPLLSIWDGKVTRRIKGAALWALVPYFEARLQDLPRGGWLHQDEAFDRWQELRPDAASEPKRMGQDRNRVKKLLEDAGVVVEKLLADGDKRVNHLFERSRKGGVWLVRLAPDPERLSLVDEG